jgi:hypothetical protein
MCSVIPIVVPAKAGTQYVEALVMEAKSRAVLDPRLRGDDSWCEAGN